LHPVELEMHTADSQRAGLLDAYRLRRFEGAFDLA
jgi:hypothetical protein